MSEFTPYQIEYRHLYREYMDRFHTKIHQYLGDYSYIDILGEDTCLELLNYVREGITPRSPWVERWIAGDATKFVEDNISLCGNGIKKGERMDKLLALSFAIYNILPHDSHGSHEKVAAWKKSGGLLAERLKSADHKC